MDGRVALNKLAELMDSINNLTDEEIQAAEEEAQRQTEFNHPFKRGTMQRIHASGKHNLKIIAKVKELREMMLD